MIGGLTISDDIAGEFARIVTTAFADRPGETFSLALSGGSTARSCYERLAAEAATAIDWWKVDVYWGDERCVPHDDIDSNYRLAREALLDRVGAANATHLMRCAEVEAYELRLLDLEAIDLIHLGLGPDAHTASLFPGSPALEADPSRLVTLNHDPAGNNPYERMTLTHAGIARSRQVVVTVAGEHKADALARVARGEDVPGANITAPRVTWLADPAAASRLEA